MDSQQDDLVEMESSARPEAEMARRITLDTSSIVYTILSLCLSAFFIFHSREIKEQGSRVQQALF